MNASEIGDATVGGQPIEGSKEPDRELRTDDEPMNPGDASKYDAPANRS